jgi:hypothetical protein
MKHNICPNIVLDEMACIRPIVRQSGHIHGQWLHAGRHRVCLSAVTPSNHDAPLNARAWIRQQLRLDGLL